MDEVTDEPLRLVSHSEARLQDARHVLWYFGDTALGYQPGSFTGHLLRAMAVADAENIARLSFAFRDLTATFLAGREDIECLRDLVKAATF